MERVSDVGRFGTTFDANVDVGRFVLSGERGNRVRRVNSLNLTGNVCTVIASSSLSFNFEKAITSPDWTGGKVYYKSGNV